MDMGIFTLIAIGLVGSFGLTILIFVLRHKLNRIETELSNNPEVLDAKSFSEARAKIIDSKISAINEMRRMAKDKELRMMIEEIDSTEKFSQPANTPMSRIATQNKEPYRPVVQNALPPAGNRPFTGSGSNGGEEE